MNACWATCLGDCSDKISREHLVSRSLFLGEGVRVRGLPWCKTESKEIGISNLTSKILCEKHNNDSSPLDQAAANAFDSIREMTRLTGVRRKMKPRPWHVVRYRLDGQNLERWFLKTLINLSFGGPLQIGADAAQTTGWPSTRLVSIVFGRAEFAGRAGLYSVVHNGQRIDSEEELVFAALVQKAEDRIEGGLFKFHGFRFLLFLEPSGPQKRLSGVKMDEGDWAISQLKRHTREITETQGDYASQILTISW